MEIKQKICCTCGTQYSTNFTSDTCYICSEERQYIPEMGQLWTDHSSLMMNYKNKFVKHHNHLFEIVIEPTFAIGQRAFLVISEGGNILLDCVPLLDQETIDFIHSKGGLKAICFSHPHYYSNMNDWAETFDCPIYIHKKDEQFIVDKGIKVFLWEGEVVKILDDIVMYNIGGHFAGSSVLIVPKLSKGGTMLCGDTMYLSPNKKHFAIMYSYPNRIPLPKSEIKRIKDRLNIICFDTVFGFYSYQNLTCNAKEILQSSFKRYEV